MIRKLMVAVAVLGFAGSSAIAQGVSFSGSADMGVKYAGAVKDSDGFTTDESMITWISNFDIAMSASGTTDGGLTFGAGATVKAGNSASVVGASNAYIGGESWKISIGDLDPASHKGRSLGDVGYDGLGVDDVAEVINAYEGTAADVELSFSLGTASLAITAGQTSKETEVTVKEAVAAVAAVAAKPATYKKVDQTTTTIFATDTTEVSAVTASNVLNKFKSTVRPIATIVETGSEERNTFSYVTVEDEVKSVENEEISEDFYIHTLTQDDIDETALGHIFETITDVSRIGEKIIIKVVGVKDTKTGTANSGDIDPAKEGVQADQEDEIATTVDLRLDTNERLDYTENTVKVDGDEIDTPAVEGTPAVSAVPAVMKTVTSQDTQWAAGVSFDVGGTTLGIGMDSEKLMQASISADLGAFSGKLFYSQQKMDDGKNTGTGVEIGVSAGENTSINAVYAQGKTGDDTSKGFGVGVSHGLGGGASLAAGFAKVEDQTKASVGVSMSF